MKRKLFFLSLAFVLCLSVSSVNAASVSLLPDVQDAFPGDFVAIDLVIDFPAASFEDILGATLSISFNPAELIFDSFTWDGAFFDPAEWDLFEIPPGSGNFIPIDDPTTMSDPAFTFAPTLSPGLLSGLGFGNFDGITSATVGTLLFQVASGVAPGTESVLGLTASADSFLSAYTGSPLATDLNPASVNVVPIPGAILLLGSGLIGLLGLRRKSS